MAKVVKITKILCDSGKLPCQLSEQTVSGADFR